MASAHRFASTPPKHAPQRAASTKLTNPDPSGSIKTTPSTHTGKAHCTHHSIAWASSPSMHPFLRPAITANQSPPASIHTSLHGRTAYYNPRGPGGDAASVRVRRDGSVKTMPTRTRPPSAPPAPMYEIRRGIHVRVKGEMGSGGGGSSNGDIGLGRESGMSEAKEFARRSRPIPPLKMSRWEEKVAGDLRGWRGGKGTPRSSVPQDGATDTYFGQPHTGLIGRDLPKEIVRVQRTYALKDICQFSPVLPVELEGRIAPTAFTFFMEALNIHLREAYSTKGAVVDNVVAVLTWWTSLLWRKSKFEAELRRAEEVIRQANQSTFNPAGLNVLSPRSVALQYLEIEYY